MKAPHSRCPKPLNAQLTKLDKMLDKIDRYNKNQKISDSDLSEDILPYDDDDDDDFLINRAKYPYHLSELDLNQWKQDLHKGQTNPNRCLGQCQIYNAR